MTTETSETQERTDPTTDPAVRELGTDCTGTRHFYDRDQHAILAIDGAGGRDRLPLRSDVTVGQYRASVAQRRGWAKQVVSVADLFA